MRRTPATSLLAAVAVAGVLGAGAVDAPSAPSPLLLVANKGDRTLGLIDPVAGRQVATVPESGTTGHEVIASPDGRLAYVPIYGDSGVGAPGSDGATIDVFDLRDRRRTATIDLGRPERPHCAAFGSDGRLYVTTELTDTLTVIDPRTNAIVDHIPTGQPESHMVVLNRDATRAYTSNVHAGSVSAIDIPNRKVLAVIKVSPISQRISLSPDGRWVFTADQTAPRLAMIDTGTNEIAHWVDLPGIAYGTAPTPDGRFLVLALVRANKVGLLDIGTREMVGTVDVPEAPQFVLVRPDGRAAYVSCDRAARIAEIALPDLTVSRLVEAGRMADGLAWAPAAP